METKNEENGENNLEIEETNKNTEKNNYKKKPSRGMHIFSVVMFMLRRRRRRKSFNTRFWRRVVESVRKVHSDITIMPSSNFINTIILPPPPPPPLPPAETSHDGGVDNDDEDDEDDDDDGDHVPEAIEVFTAASSSSTSSGISGYGSAMSLRDLDNHYYYNDDDDEDNDDDDECYSDGEGGDDMIDEKAEEFIVKFYEQMKMQNQVYTKRCKAKGIMIN